MENETSTGGSSKQVKNPSNERFEKFCKDFGIGKYDERGEPHEETRAIALVAFMLQDMGTAIRNRR